MYDYIYADIFYNLKAHRFEKNKLEIENTELSKIDINGNQKIFDQFAISQRKQKYYLVLC